MKAFLIDGDEYAPGIEIGANLVGMAGENLVHEVLDDHGIESHMTEYLHPLDLIVPGKCGIEIKTITHPNEIYMCRQTKRRKRKFCKEHNLTEITVVVKVLHKEWHKYRRGEDVIDLRYKEGFKSFHYRSMKDFQELVNVIRKI